MKGLLIKDLYIIKGYGIWTVAICVIFAAVSMIEGSDTFLMFTAMYSALVSVNTMAYDERGHWDTYADSLPVSRAQVVISKYLMPFAAMLIVWVIYIAGRMTANVCMGTDTSANIVSTSVYMWTAWSLIASILYPFLFRFGVEKGKVVYILMIMIVAGIVGANLSLNENNAEPGRISDIITSDIAVPALIMSVFLLAISVMLSIRFYNKRDL
ncbi:MAG: ABC-2 transporter permease [Clostridia bacterium]|nr:ABC-2 transporter permease [Clostridia bacterium]